MWRQRGQYQSQKINGLRQDNHDVFPNLYEPASELETRYINERYNNLNYVETSVNTGGIIYRQELQQPEQLNVGSLSSQPNINYSIENETFLRNGLIPANDISTQGGQYPYRWEEAINTKRTKRRSEEGDDSSSSSAPCKQRITDERMAAGMSTLYITNEHNYYYTNPTIFNPKDTPSMVFSETQSAPVELQSVEEDDRDNENITSQTPARDVFKFNAPLEQYMKNKNEILPPEIIQEICKPCLALIPYTPPLIKDEEEITTSDEKDRVIENKPVKDNKTENLLNSLNSSITSSNRCFAEPSWVWETFNTSNKAFDEMDL